MLSFLFVVFAAFLLAKVEIQIEGKNGYAKNLPVTWRAKNKWVKNILGGTSYHLYMWALMLTLMHIPFVVGLRWSLGREAMVVSLLLFITVLEDFLWFVLNLTFGIHKFKQECIPWFEDRWLWFCPAWYFWYLSIAVVLYLVGSR